MNKFDRRDILLSENQIEKIKSAKLALFGLGGVGGYALEVFARMGFTDFVLVDGDIFTITNINRQLLATQDSLNKDKVIIAKERIISINEEVVVKTYKMFVNENNVNDIDLTSRYIVDMIDDVNGKVALAKYAKKNNLPIISMMGAGNRIDATFIRSDINKTEYDPLAKIMRKKLKENNINKLSVVYTKDLAIKNNFTEIGSLANVCMKAGSAIASEVIKDIIGD